jgi:hypothetical protein
MLRGHLNTREVWFANEMEGIPLDLRLKHHTNWVPPQLLQNYINTQNSTKTQKINIIKNGAG